MMGPFFSGLVICTWLHDICSYMRPKLWCRFPPSIIKRKHGPDYIHRTVRVRKCIMPYVCPLCQVLKEDKVRVRGSFRTLTRLPNKHGTRRVNVLTFTTRRHAYRTSLTSS